MKNRLDYLLKWHELLVEDAMRELNITQPTTDFMTFQMQQPKIIKKVKQLQEQDFTAAQDIALQRNKKG